MSTVGWVHALILLAIGLVLAAGSLVAGIAGAIIAVPVAAVIHRATPALLGLDGAPEPAQEDDGDDESTTPSSSQ